MAATTEKHPLLKQSLYIFSLPPELIESLHPRSASHLLEESKSRPEATQDAEEETTGLGCATCKIGSLQSVSNQRSHFRSDWHRYNQKMRRTGHPSKIVSEEQFASQAEQLDGSISGSDSSESDSDSSILDQTARLKLEDQNISTTLTMPKSPIVWFSSNLIPDTQFGMYRTTLPGRNAANSLPSPQAFLEQLKADQLAAFSTSKLPPTPALHQIFDPEEKTWALFMIGGGHFAGMIISQVPKMVKSSGKWEREWVILEHKTVHRYTTRRKQGGAQGLNDQAKGKAKSAGAQIRRYNEAALQDDVRATLAAWKDRLSTASSIYMRSSKANSQIFYNYEEAPFGRQDPRVHTIPFPTRRPTLAELRRVYEELTKVKLSFISENTLAEMDRAFVEEQTRKQQRLQQSLKASIHIPKVAQVSSSPKLSDEDVLLRKRWQRIIEMVEKGRLDALITFVEKRSAEDADADAVKEWTQTVPAWSPVAIPSPTILHLASANGQANVVRWLLLDCRCDPTLTSPTQPRTAYEVGETRATRNVFRRCMAEHPDWFDWTDKAKVPSPLTEEQEAEQREKAKERKSKLKDRAKEREEIQKQADAKQRLIDDGIARERAAADQQRKEAAPNKPQKLGGVGASIARAKANESLAGLSEEAKMRIERERRARAAEARFGR